MKPLRARPAALLPLLFLLTPSAFAQTRYDVEIVVFEQTPAGGGEERWRPGIALPAFARAGSFEPDPEAEEAGLRALPEAFERLSDGSRLRQAAERIDASGGYRVLRHLHWRQPALGAGESVPVRVSAGDPIAVRVPVSELERPVPAAGNTEATLAEEESGDAEDEQAARTADVQDPDEFGAGDRDAELGALDALGVSNLRELERRLPQVRTVSVRPLDGTIELIVSRYLHVHADLYYTTDVEWERTVVAERADTGTGAAEPNASDEDMTTAAASAAAPRIARGPDDAAMLSFPFKQRRRMRSGELHYLDHPRVGLLVLVTPYQPEEPEADDGA